jgi:phosphoribosylanthranilate isomerase
VNVKVKICGLRDTASLDAAARHGADFLGFVFFSASPRFIEPPAAGALMARAPTHVRRVGLFVDPADTDIADVLAHCPIDMIQLHGQEPPERVAALRARFALPIMKAVGVAETADLDRARTYASVADWLLLDARPRPSDTRPGGNARSFDWSLLGNFFPAVPWMLAGGLDPNNIGEAVRQSGARAVDVSSGVESAPGIKDPEKIRAFLACARDLSLASAHSFAITRRGDPR